MINSEDVPAAQLHEFIDRESSMGDAVFRREIMTQTLENVTIINWLSFPPQMAVY